MFDLIAMLYLVLFGLCLFVVTLVKYGVTLLQLWGSLGAALG
jgi:hypothetical protein